MITPPSAVDERELLRELAGIDGVKVGTPVKENRDYFLEFSHRNQQFRITALCAGDADRPILLNMEIAMECNGVYGTSHQMSNLSELEADLRTLELAAYEGEVLAPLGYWSLLK